jgi:hypothetical protein
MVGGRRSAAVLVLAFLLVTGACGGSEDAATSTSFVDTTTSVVATCSSTTAEPATTAAPSTTTTLAGSSGEGSADNAGWIVSLLSRIPDTETSGRYVALVDLRTAAQAAGVEIPPVGAQATEVTGYLFALPGDALLPDLLQRAAASVDDVRAELGTDPVSIETAVTAGDPPKQYVVLQGDFDEGTVDSAVRGEPVWSDLLTTAEHSGVSYYTWGEDFASVLDRVTAARPLGRGSRLALDNGYLYWVPWTAGVEALIDAGAGTIPRLADHPRMRQAAEVLQREHVYSAALTDVPLLADPLGTPSEEGVAGYLAPYLVLGLGGGQDDAGVFWVVVAIHDSTAAAEQSAAGFRVGVAEGTAVVGGARWSERVTAMEVTVEGNAMVAVLRSANPPGDWMRAYQSRDPLLAVAGN